MNDALEQMVETAFGPEATLEDEQGIIRAAIAAIPEDDDVLCDAVRDAIHYWITDQTCKRIIAALKAALLESGDG